MNLGDKGNRRSWEGRETLSPASCTKVVSKVSEATREIMATATKTNPIGRALLVVRVGKIFKKRS